MSFLTSPIASGTDAVAGKEEEFLRCHECPLRREFVKSASC